MQAISEKSDREPLAIRGGILKGIVAHGHAPATTATSIQPSLGLAEKAQVMDVVIPAPPDPVGLAGSMALAGSHTTDTTSIKLLVESVVERRSLAEEKKHSVREASKLAGISESALRLEINKGRIPILKIASKIQILASDLERFLRGHYGAVQRTVESVRVSSRLPKHIAESELINPKRKSA